MEKQAEIKIEVGDIVRLKSSTLQGVVAKLKGEGPERRIDVRVVTFRGEEATVLALELDPRCFEKVGTVGEQINKLAWRGTDDQTLFEHLARVHRADLEHKGLSPDLIATVGQREWRESFAWVNDAIRELATGTPTVRLAKPAISDGEGWQTTPPNTVTEGDVARRVNDDGTTTVIGPNGDPDLNELAARVHRQLGAEPHAASPTADKATDKATEIMKPAEKGEKGSKPKASK